MTLKNRHKTFGENLAFFAQTTSSFWKHVTGPGSGFTQRAWAFAGLAWP
jgi:hypothetical protein